jgi:hypothetical protein
VLVDLDVPLVLRRLAVGRDIRRFGSNLAQHRVVTTQRPSVFIMVALGVSFQGNYTEVLFIVLRSYHLLG